MELVLRLFIAGVMVGTLYGLVGVTLTLMLRSSGFLSFAHAGFALIAAYSYIGWVCPPDIDANRPCGDPVLPPMVAAAAAIVLATAAALLVERFVARPLAHASPAAKVIGTAATLALISGILLQIYGANPRNVSTIPGRHILPRGRFEIAGIVISKQQFAIFVLSIVIVALLGLLLRRSWFGLGVRAAGQLPETSRLMGISPVAVSRFNWALGGLLSGLAGVLIGPITIVNIGTFSFLLVKAVAAVLVGGLVSLPLTFAGGIAIGVAEALAPHFWATTGIAEVAIGVIVLVMLVVNRRKFAVVGYSGPVQDVRSTGPFAVAAARVLASMRDTAARLPRILGLGVGVAILVVPLRSAYYASIGVVALYYTLVALSVIVITGTTGQLSFMQAGFVSVGAFGLATTLRLGWSLPVALATTVAVCVAIGAVFGAVSLRFRGLEFAIASVALGAVLSAFVVTRPGVDTNLTDPQLFGRSLFDARFLFMIMLLAAALAMVAVANIRRSAWGRALFTMREMHTRVEHFGVPGVRAEVALLGVSAGIAGLAGAFFALQVVSLEPALFVPLVSVTIVLTAVVGGLQSLAGAVIAGLIFGPGQEIVGRLFSSESANAFPQIVSALLAMVIIVGMPNGLASLFAWSTEVSRRAAPVAGHHRFRGRPIPAPADRTVSAVRRRRQTGPTCEEGPKR
jgi:sulfate-transporting ATPase